MNYCRDVTLYDFRHEQVFFHHWSVYMYRDMDNGTVLFVQVNQPTTQGFLHSLADIPQSFDDFKIAVSLESFSVIAAAFLLALC